MFKYYIIKAIDKLKCCFKKKHMCEVMRKREYLIQFYHKCGCDISGWGFKKILILILISFLKQINKKL